MATTTTTIVEEIPRVISSRDVASWLNYYDDPGDGTLPTPVIVGKTKVTNERPMIKTDVTIQDLTGRESSFNLTNSGFQLIQRGSSAAATIADGFHDEEKIMTEYFDDCAQLLKDVTGANRVFIFDHKVRRGDANWHKLGEGNAVPSKRGPLFRAHVDQSYDGAEFLVRWYFPDEAEELLKRRYQIINVWRPIQTVYRDPLAVADGRSVPDADLVEARAIHSDHERRTWTMKAGPHTAAHRWYYKHGMTPEEALLIKCFDSVADGSVARRAPHSAFPDPTYTDAHPRESIEIRAFVFY